MRPIISFLIGSGFSIPEEIPGTAQINARMSKIHESEILIHTDMTAIFLKGQHDPNRYTRRDERFFVQQFLEFYNAEILTEGQSFHYERFYDFYSSYLHHRENQEPIERFCEHFNQNYFGNSKGTVDCLNRISYFNTTFNQLLASLLHKDRYFENVSPSDWPPYHNFFRFIRHLIEDFDVKIHSLNHDLFLDWYGSHGPFFQDFADGYELAGSPFYGDVDCDYTSISGNRIHKTYKAKLEHFTERFDKPICLYKLHGGIMNVRVYTPDKKWVRIKDNFAVQRYYIELFDESAGTYRFEHLYDDVSPDFLSGTTEKTRYYVEDSYYETLFKHFERNLKASELLFVIGYGLGDPGINKYLEEFYLSKGKTMIVIDPGDLQSEPLQKYPHARIQKSITDVAYEEYLQLMGGR